MATSWPTLVPSFVATNTVILLPGDIHFVYGVRHERRRTRVSALDFACLSGLTSGINVHPGSPVANPLPLKTVPPESPQEASKASIMATMAMAAAMAINLLSKKRLIVYSFASRAGHQTTSILTAHFFKVRLF